MLTEAYRPATFADVVGQGKTVRQIALIRKRSGLGGKSFFLSGQSGTGKTTIARLIAREIASELAIVEVNAREVDLEFIRDMERDFRFHAVAADGEPTGRAWILNEAHLLRGPIISRLLTTLEPGNVPPHCVVIFTTTTDGQESLFEDYADASPLLSRCLRLDLSRRGLADVFAQRLLDICHAEGLVRPTLKQCKDCLQEKRNNLRAAIQDAEAGRFIECDDALALAAVA